MLVEFSIENFLSIKDKQTFSMVAADMKELPENTFEHDALPLDQHKLLKSAVIYGPNAAGKSNILKAFAKLKELVITSHRNQVGDNLDIIPFKLDDETPKQPSFFEVIFIKDNIRYMYGIRADNTKVYDEYLYYWTNEIQNLVFERSETNKFNFAFSEETEKEKAKQEIYLEQTLENILFLSQATKLKHPQATNAFEWFFHEFWVSPVKNFLIYSLDYQFTTDRILEQPAFKQKMAEYLSVADMDIHNVSVIEKEPVEESIVQDVISLFTKLAPNRSKDSIKITFDLLGKKAMDIRMVHHYTDDENIEKAVEFEFDWESEGTKKYYGLIGRIDNVLENGYTFIIDELDIHLHSKLAKKLIELFHSPERNPKNAQLIFSTHTTNLLDQNLFRRDQIWFVEKNRKSKNTELFSLSEFSNVPDNLGYEKSYLQGRFGAIPLLEEWE